MCCLSFQLVYLGLFSLQFDSSMYRFHRNRKSVQCLIQYLFMNVQLPCISAKCASTMEIISWLHNDDAVAKPIGAQPIEDCRGWEKQERSSWSPGKYSSASRSILASRLTSNSCCHYSTRRQMAPFNAAVRAWSTLSLMWRPLAIERQDRRVTAFNDRYYYSALQQQNSNYYRYSPHRCVILDDRVFLL